MTAELLGLTTPSRDFLFDADAAAKASPGKEWYPLLSERNPLWSRIAEGNVHPDIYEQMQDRFFTAEWLIIEDRKKATANEH
jgi:hypothetical protein